MKRSGLALGLALVFCPCHFPFIMIGLSFLLFGALVISLVSAMILSVALFALCFAYGAYYFLRERHARPASAPSASTTHSPSEVIPIE